jgi:adenosylmethionine-8-amino-7-oxononanoate aminotransferase
MSVPVPVIKFAPIVPPLRRDSSGTAPIPDMSDWLTPGLAHLWLPYTQMQTAPAPLAVVASEGVRLEPGRRPPS